MSPAKKANKTTSSEIREFLKEKYFQYNIHKFIYRKYLV